MTVPFLLPSPLLSFPFFSEVSSTLNKEALYLLPLLGTDRGFFRCPWSRCGHGLLHDALLAESSGQTRF